MLSLWYKYFYMWVWGFYSTDRRDSMKKGLVYLLTAVMTVGLFTACGSKEGTQEPGVTATATPEISNEQGTSNVVTNNVERVVLKDLNTEEYVTLGDYKNIEVMVAGPDVDNAEWASLNAQIYNEFVSAENGIKDRAVENGDWVNIDYSGKKDGVAFDGGTAAAQLLEIGSGMFIAGFEEGLVGVMPGETVDLDLTFPADYGNTELAGQAVVFTVTVNYIYPGEEDWSDDVVAAAGNAEYTTVEEMKQYVYDYLHEYNAYYYDINVKML